MKRTFLCLLTVLTAAASGCGQNWKALEESDRLFAEGVELYNAGKYEEAIPLFQKSDKIDKKQLDKGSNRRDYSAMWVASCHYRLGDEEEAKKWDPLFYNKTPIDRRLTVGSDAKELLGNTYYATGRYKEALDCLLEGAELERETLGEDHYNYATTLYMIEQCYTMLGDYVNAYNTVMQACSIQLKELGIHHPYTALSLSDMAGFESMIGNFETAIQYETMAMEAFGDFYGRESLYYLHSLTGLAFYNQRLGKYAEAVRLQTEAVGIMEAAYGKKSGEYGEGLNTLAGYWSFAGNYAEAVRAGEQALKIYEKAYGADSMEYASLLSDLSGYYSDSGDWNAAIQRQSAAVAIYAKYRDGDPEGYAMAASSLALLYTESGDFAGSSRLYLETMDFLDGTAGKSCLAYAGALNGLALCEYATGNYPNAIGLNELALQTYRRALGGAETYSPAVLESLADCYKALGNYTEAADYIQEALKIQEGLSGNETPDYANVLGKLADIHAETGDITGEIQLETQALEIIAGSLGTDHVRYAEFLDNLADLYVETGDLNKAMEAGTRATAIYKAYGETTSEYALSLTNLSRYCFLSGDYDKAVQLDREALGIFETVYGKRHPGYSTTLIGLASYEGAAGNHEAAVQLAQEAAETIGRTYGEFNNDYINTTAILAYESFAGGDWAKTVEYAAKTSTTLYAVIANTFTTLTANERSLLWNKRREWFEVQMPLFTFSIPTDEMKSLEYDTVLMSKGLLLNSETELGNLLMESGDEEAVAKYRALQQNRTALGRLYEQPVAERRMDADSLENVVKRQEQELLRLSKAYGDYTKNLSVSWRQVQEGLGEDDAAIEFLDIDTGQEHAYVALTLTKADTAPQLAYLFDLKDLEGVGKADYYTTPAVSGLVWKPLAQTLQGKKNVYFSPAGELYNIAIESLPDFEGDGLISDRWNLYRLSSTRSLALEREEVEPVRADVYGGMKYSAGAQTLVNDFERHGGVRSADFASVDADSLGLRGGVSDLPGTKVEAEKIDRVLAASGVEKHVYTDTLGTETSLKSLSGKRPNILHIATHGFFWSESEAQDKRKLRFLAMSDNGSGVKYAEDKMMTRSGLLFSGANLALSGRALPDGVDDGVLTAKEISVLDLRGLDLAVLSACQTGLGEITGDGVFGLQRGFKKAGANSLMMSLWKVNDTATQIFMAHFYYDLLCEKMPKRAAFLDAQHYLRTTEGGKYDKPENWAAFILLDALD